MDNKESGPKALYSLLILTWPNLISLSRLVSLPLIAWLLLENHVLAAFIACVIAGLSDMFDGFVARMLKTQSTVGAYLDPLADKVLLVGVFYLLSYKGWVDPWLFFIVIFRDLLIIGGALLLFISNKSFNVKPLMVSKINTLLQIVLVAWILGSKALEVEALTISSLLIYSVTTTTIISGIAYMVAWLRYFAYSESKT